MAGANLGNVPFVQRAFDGGSIAFVNDSDGPVVVGDPSRMVGYFWDVMHGRAPTPPVGELLGSTPEHVDSEAGTATVRYEAKPEFTNSLGTVQGGLVAAMLDYAMATALVATLDPGHLAPTLEMKVSYLAAAVGARAVD